MKCLRVQGHSEKKIHDRAKNNCEELAPELFPCAEGKELGYQKF